MKVLFALHDPPYGTERTYNGIRWARQMLEPAGEGPANEVKVFLFADAVVSIMSEQKTPDGFYNIASMLKAFVRKGGVVGICGSCLDARGITEDMILKGAHRSSMAELGEWTTWADQVINV
jgi:uncharacterized protein involved in oxidation of intracellular sulfur